MAYSPLQQLAYSGNADRARDLLRIEVDPDDVFTRVFTELEQQNIPYAVMQASNATGFEVKRAWERAMPRVFDRPTPRTIRAVWINKGKYSRGAGGKREYTGAEIGIRDESRDDPAAWLRIQVEGGARKQKGLERALDRRGYLNGLFAVPAKGQAFLDQYGNIERGIVQPIISQLQASFDSAANETEGSRKKRHRRQLRKFGRTHDYFALKQRRGALPPGIYRRQNADGAFGSSLRLVFAFVRQPHYQKRYEIFAIARRTWESVMPFHFERELAKAVQNSRFKGAA